MTLQCLHSLSASTSVPLQVILVDDCSPEDPTSIFNELAQKNPGFIYERNTSNLGFIGSCNRGAELADAQLLFFLNNDTLVLPDAVQTLVDTITHHPNVGLVGAQLVYPSGRLQESGGIVWKDGSANNWGNKHDPNNPRFTYMRDTDYCSAAAILIPKADFLSLGGFDKAFAPGYYEDTDLAFKVRSKNKRVVVQPQAKVIHLEGGTAGTDVSTGMKKHQVINQTTFAESWRDSLMQHGVYGDCSSSQLHRYTQKRVLIIDQKFPEPDRDSGSIDCVNMIQILQNLNHHCTMLAVKPLPFGNNLKTSNAYSQQLESQGVACPHSPYVLSLRQYLKEHGSSFDVVILNRAHIAYAHVSAVKKYAPQAKVIYNSTDLSFVREERESKAKASQPIMGSLYAMKAAWSKHMELASVKHTDETMVISPTEQTLLTQLCPNAKVAVVPLIREIPSQGPGFERRSGVMFIGGYKHRPNVDAVEYLVQDIMPLVWETHPYITLHLVGSHMPHSFSVFKGNIKLHGHVPDLRTLYDSVKLSVAPLRFGAGLKGKVVESMGYGVPVVGTPCAFEGMPVTHQQNAWIASNPHEFVQHMLILMNHSQSWTSTSEQAYALVQGMYSISSVSSHVTLLLEHQK